MRTERLIRKSEEPFSREVAQLLRYMLTVRVIKPAGQQLKIIFISSREIQLKFEVEPSLTYEP